MSIDLRPDQIEDLGFTIVNPKCLLMHEPGVGKTPIVVVRQWMRWSEQGARTVWVMPKSLLKKNRDEILRFTPFGEEDVAIIDGTPKKVQAALASNAKVFLVGPDRFRMLDGKLPAGVKAIDVDEFHMCFKGPTSQRTQTFLQAVRKMSDAILMSGTLVDGRLDSAWPAIHAMSGQYYPLGYRQFLAAHAILDEYDRPVAWRNHERVGKILAKHGVRRTFADVYGHQEIVTQVETVQMHARQRELYDELAEQAMVELEEVMVDGTVPGVSVIRARQIMEHPEAFPDPRGEGYNPIDLLDGALNGKLERLQIMVEDHAQRGTPFVIFAAFVAQQDRIFQLVEEAGVKVELMNSIKSARQRSQIDEQFRAGKIQAIVTSPPIAGVGFNWQFWGPKKDEVCHAIFASLTYLDTDYSQAVRRFVRAKRARPLRVSVLAYEDSIDDRMMKIIEVKSKDANKVDATREVISFVQ